MTRPFARRVGQFRHWNHTIGCGNPVNPGIKQIMHGVRNSARIRQMQRVLRQETAKAISYMNKSITGLSEVQRNAFKDARTKFNTLMHAIYKYNIVPGVTPFAMIIAAATGAGEKAPVLAATRISQNVMVIQRFVQNAMNLLHRHLGFTKSDAGKPVCLADIPVEYYTKELEKKVQMVHKDLKVEAQVAANNGHGEMCKELMKLIPFPEDTPNGSDKGRFNLTHMCAFVWLLDEAFAPIHITGVPPKATETPCQGTADEGNHEKSSWMGYFTGKADSWKTWMAGIIYRAL